MPDWLIAIILGIVEGLTEFIPVSSTGHLIVIGDLLNFEGPAGDTFEVFIQLGAILAIVVLYRDRFTGFLKTDSKTDSRNGFRGPRGLMLLALVSFPGALTGLLAYSFIKDQLFSSMTVAIGWVVGGIALLVVERALPEPKTVPAPTMGASNGGGSAVMTAGDGSSRKTVFTRKMVPEPKYETLDDLNWKVALGVGLFQCLALWPGMSRSASTIVGGMFLGISRKAAAEFSFFAAVPLIAGASAYDLWSNWDVLTREDIPIFASGFVVAFIAALFAVRWFVNFLGARTMAPFGWYRIIAGGILILTLL